MKKLLLLMLTVFVSIGAWAALTVTPSDGGNTITITTENMNECNFTSDQQTQIIAAKQLILVGKFSSNDLNNLQNGGLNGGKTTIDFSNAEFEANVQKFSIWSNSITTAIMSEKTSSYYNNGEYDNLFSNCKNITVIKYKGMTANVTKNSDNTCTITYTKSGNTTDDEYFHNALSLFKGEAGLKEIIANNPESPTSWDAETHTLTLSSADANNIANLSDLYGQVSNISKIVFADGSVWERDATDATKGVLNTKQYPDTHAAALTAANLPITTTYAALGKYVTLITEGNNPTVTQIQTNGAITSSNASNFGSWPDITDDEKSAAASATNIKLAGPFNATTFKAVGDYTGNNLVSLDMSESTGLESTALPGNITTNLQKVILPNTMTDIPTSFAQEYTNLTTVVMSSATKTIGVKAFYKCNNLKFVNGGEEGIVSFPTTLEEIGGDAFFGCYQFATVNLDNLPSLWKVDYAAFNMGNGGDEFSQLETVNLPSSDNNVLTFWGNQVFSCTNVTTLDFSHCLGIEHFAYDGSTEDPAHQGQTTTSNETFTYFNKLQTILLPPNLLYVAKNAFSHCDDLTTVTFTGRANYDNTCKLTNKLTIDDFAFDKCQNLAEVNFSDNLWKIGQHAFDKTHLTTVSIPASVDEIGHGAFNENDYLTTVIFEDIAEDCKCGTTENKPEGNNTLIKGTTTNANGEVELDNEGNPVGGMGAFWNCKAIRDVYINNQTQLECENLAFVFDVTYGHADASASLATLHFPEKDIDHYANLDHYLTDQISANPGLFHKWLHEHFRQAIIPKHNGWYEFVNSGPTNNIDNPDDVCQEIVLRTFSSWSHSYLVPEGMRAYIVNKIEQKENGSWEVTLRRLLAIPAKTGVILYGHPNGKNTLGQPIISMTPISYARKGQNIKVYDKDGNITYEGPASEDQGKPLSRDYWDNLSKEANKNKPISDYDLYKNYLEPTSTPTQADQTLFENRITNLQAKLNNPDITEAERTDYEAELAGAQADLAEITKLWTEHEEDWKKDGKFWGGRYLKPYDNVDDDHPMTVSTTEDVAFRNFGLSRYNKTTNLKKARPLQSGEDDYEAFFRLKKGYYPSGKAYLRLADDEYDDAYGAEILVKKDEGDYDEYIVKDENGNEVMENGEPKKATSPKDSYYIEYSKNDGSKLDMRAEGTSNPHQWWMETKGFDWDIYDVGDTYGAPRKNWGVRPGDFDPNPLLPGAPSNAPIYLGEFEEDTDGTVKLIIPAKVIENDEYYTLQGVKVINPTKGIYINNGKKVIIK